MHSLQPSYLEIMKKVIIATILMLFSFSALDQDADVNNSGDVLSTSTTAEIIKKDCSGKTLKPWPVLLDHDKGDL